MKKNTCPHCGEGNNPNSKYCLYCGYELPKMEIPEPQPVVQQRKMKSSKRKLLIGLIVGISASVLFFVIARFLVLSFFSFDKVLMKVASKLNETCPVMVDEATRLDNAVAMPGNKFQYNYTLVNLTKEDVDINSFSEYMKPQLTNNIKTNPDLKLYRDHKVTLVYNYKDKNGTFVVKFEIEPASYLDD